jgi:glycosyltransferase involved in cell wall biosynthesis
MDQQIQLSVVIPVYNGGGYIRETIDSVLINSEGFPVECIVIDDGSTDITPEIIDSYKDKVRKFRQVNAGESAAVNRGLAEALGEYIVIVSADDPILTPKLFCGVVDFFENHTSAVAWYPDWRVINDLGEVTKQITLKDFEFYDLFCKNQVLPGPGTWFRASAARAIGGRRSKWKYVGDYDFWLRLSMFGDLVHRRAVLAQWRSHSGSTSISHRGPEMAAERIGVIEEFIEEFRGRLLQEHSKVALASAHYFAARLGFFSPEVDSRRLFIRAVSHSTRIITIKRIHEIFFMVTFPASKWIVDFFSTRKRNRS